VEIWIEGASGEKEFSDSIAGRLGYAISGINRHNTDTRGYIAEAVDMIIFSPMAWVLSQAAIEGNFYQ